MKKVLIGLLACATVITLASPVFISAYPTDDVKGLKGKIGQAGSSNNGFVELWEKNPDDWSVITEGAWAKMKYSLTGETFDVHFNGHGLEPGVAYSLIYYPDPWPGANLIVLGEGTPNEEGNLLIKGSVVIDGGVLPIESDANFEDGAKIWLVLTADIAEGEGGWSMIGWNPAEYLFEYDLIGFNDVDFTVHSGGGGGKDTAPGQNKEPGEPATGKAKGKNK